MNEQCLTITLNPAVDQTVEIPSFRPGWDYRVNAGQSTAGGKGINVARALQQLGVKVRTTGFLGGEAGQVIRRSLAAERLADDFVCITGTTRICLTVRDKDKRQQTRLIPDGPAVTRKEIRVFITQYERLLRQVSWVVLSGRIINGAGDDFYAELIARAQRHGSMIILDTSGEALRRGLLARPDFVKPNRSEAEFIWGQRIRSQQAAVLASEKILSFGVKGVILSLGREGILAACGQERSIVKTPVIESGDTVGCGDALVAGFVDGLKKGYPFKKAVCWAAATGAANVLAKRPGGISLAKARAILKETTIRDVK